jgi:hypothetical protein
MTVLDLPQLRAKDGKRNSKLYTQQFFNLSIGFLSKILFFLTLEM